MNGPAAALQPRFHARIDEIPADAWDALRADDSPFLSHAFLHALERTDCIRVGWGWAPHHLGLYDGGRLVAAAPLYLKGNSHGEFVFDWSWASAWERAGGEYYPKLLNAVPYSPVSGARLLAGRDAHAPARRRALVTAMRGEVDRLGLSSLHANFLAGDDLPAFDEAWLARTDVQFHWHNHGYADFDAFLAALNHKKRKNIRQERAQVARSGLRIERCGGARLSPAEWHRVHALYEATFDAKGNHAALTRAFFLALGDTLGDAVQLALARDGDRIVAMALLIQGDHTLYGRYWGSAVEVPGLHFELCYYQGIEHAIARGLDCFEPGAQGEHKLARGFLPTHTHSRHYLAHPQFRRAVRDALVHETASVRAYADELRAHSPYARDREPGGDA
ncbi:MAG: GNAT family N-acetyltransferase [Xanthomonadaceae bacterium]|nr:GNAT family N-acetyltransferase [Xanthomonadaceae bacterium]MDE1963631.1 N-acetyltransferase [Xanthomonadaceae bacterium]